MRILSKPTIYFDSLKDEFYPNGCWLCGHEDKQGDKGVGDCPKTAYLDWLQWNSNNPVIKAV